MPEVAELLALVEVFGVDGVVVAEVAHAVAGAGGGEVLRLEVFEEGGVGGEDAEGVDDGGLAVDRLDGFAVESAG